MLETDIQTTGHCKARCANGRLTALKIYAREMTTAAVGN